MRFKMTMSDHPTPTSTEHFTEDTGPWWLTGKEYKWFWDKHVLTLNVGETVDTDFRTIERIE